MKKLYFLLIMLFVIPADLSAQHPASNVQYAFGKKIFGYFKAQKADMLITAIDPSADDQTKQIISSSILSAIDKVKTLGNPTGMKLLNVLFLDNGQKMFIPVVTGNRDIAMIILDNVVEKDGGIFLGGSVHIAHSIKEKRLTEARKIYMAKCFSCHGQYAEGMVGPNMTDNFWKYAQTDNDVLDVITNGRQGTTMIAFKDYLNQDEINKLILYMSILQGQREKSGKPKEGKPARLLRNLYVK